MTQTIPVATVATSCLASGLLLVLAAALVTGRRRRSRRRLRRLTAATRPTPGSRFRLADRLTNAIQPWLANPGPRRHRVIAAVAAIAAVAGWLSAGPVAALAAATYLSAAATIGLSARDSRHADRSRTAALEAVAGLAADLRAGLPPGTALAAAWPSLSPPHHLTEPPDHADHAERASHAERLGHGGQAIVVITEPVAMLRRIDDPARAVVADRLATAWELAERTGLPLADVLDRLDAELRDRERVRVRTAAQVAGARVTTLLLAALPVAGLALGAGIGAHPLHVLLHTPAGAACAVGAILLQLLGVLWSARLSRTPDDATRGIPSRPVAAPTELAGVS